MNRLFRVIVPKMGMSTVEVDVIHWFVKEGDRVSVRDPLAEIESEKASFTIESEVNGIVDRIWAGVNETVDVGTVICTIRIEAEGGEPDDR